ncbi:facilitated trehalose transporter Tret1-like [Euwallacea fornicatus]|uniref:facilitated trehalose transporter Tret1-like n=1 Tax=Euwallacea fornicatus TaxID=995702 RepID=UPI00338D712E
MGLKENEGSDTPQILAIVAACIPGVSSALLFSWPSPFLLVLINDKENYDISEIQAGLVPIFLPIGILISSIFLFTIHDKLGRKYTLLLLCIPQFLFWLITIFARDIYSFYIGRFICGVADGIMYAALPIYIGEVATPRVRGTWGNGQTFSFNAGFLLINVLGNYFTIHQTAYICLTLPILSAILFLRIPESPYYYLMKGQDERARTSLQWLLRKPDIESDFLQLKADVQRQISETGTWPDLYNIVSNRKALRASLFLRFTQQCAGIGTFENYIQYIFDKSNSGTLSPQISSIIFSALLWIVMTLFSAGLLDKFGRRKSFIISSLGCSILLAAESIYFFLDQFYSDSIDLSNFQWFPLAALIVYIITYCGGLGPLPSLMAGELFSASIKGKGLAVTNVGLAIILFVSAFLFQSLTTSIGLYAPFAVYSTLTFICFVLSFYVIPETKGKTLEEIQQELKGNAIIRITF